MFYNVCSVKAIGKQISLTDGKRKNVIGGETRKFFSTAKARGNFYSMATTFCVWHYLIFCSCQV